MYMEPINYTVKVRGTVLTGPCKFSVILPGHKQENVTKHWHTALNDKWQNSYECWIEKDARINGHGLFKEIITEITRRDYENSKMKT